MNSKSQNQNIVYEFENKGNNEVLIVNDNCFISFNPCPGMGIGFWAADNDGSETAIVLTIKGERVYKILNGDFRDECIGILKRGGEEKEFIKLYNDNKDKHSSWSNR